MTGTNEDKVNSNFHCMSTMNFVDIVLFEGLSKTFSPKRIGDTVASKNKCEGQIPNKSNLH